MHLAQPNVPSPKEVLNLLRVHVKTWLLPAVLVAVAVGIYAIVREDTWEASQALIVRNDASGAERGQGKFNLPEEMKTIQETILEVVKSRSVLEAALLEVGPPADGKTSEAWPTDRDIAEARKNIKLIPPKGAEFGKTEVFYLSAKAENSERSVALNEAVFKHLLAQFQELRDAKAQSMIAELTKTVHLATADLNEATAALTTTENRVGSDLAELRSMQDMASSDSALRRSGEEIRASLRENAVAEKVNQELLSVLEKSQDDPGRFVATPNRLLESHSSLRRLKDGLIDAQLRTSNLQGTMSADHPKVIAAKETEDEIGRNLHKELSIARSGVEIDLRLNADRRKLLEDQLAKTNERLQALASVRAGYANQVTESKNRAVLLERAEQNLAEARATRASAKAASLISRIDTPDAGIKPVGPSRLVIALCGVLGGLLAGFGLVFLTVPAPVAAPVAVAVPAINSNGHSNGHYAKTIPGRNGSSKIPARVNGRLSLREALQTLGD
jgi:polysaccharide biosynthesis transport protein